MMLDVLGFRETVTKRPDLDFYKVWSKLKTQLKEKQLEYENDNKKIIEIDVLCLSDTIIVGLSYKSKGEAKQYENRYLLSSMTRIIDLFFINFMNKYKTFFRGVIGYGDFRFSEENDIVFGTAIDEVSCWYETCDWVGITLAPSAQYALEYMLSLNDEDNYPNTLKNIKNRYIDYKEVPCKDKIPPICHYAFCWYKRNVDNNINKANFEEILDLFSNIKHDPAYARKYSEAVKFMKHCLIEIGNKDLP